MAVFDKTESLGRAILLIVVVIKCPDIIIIVISHSLLDVFFNVNTCAIRKLPYITMDSGSTNIYLIKEMNHGEDTPTNKVYCRACG